ncbi:MAG: hypothetical protein WDK96_01795 [Candidatus Paceibacterota bacterium]|jgi:hypothetical protein
MKNMVLGFAFLARVIRELKIRGKKIEEIHKLFLSTTDETFYMAVADMISSRDWNQKSKEKIKKINNFDKSCFPACFNAFDGVNFQYAFKFLYDVISVLKKKSYKDDYICKLMDIDDFSSIIPDDLSVFVTDE